MMKKSKLTKFNDSCEVLNEVTKRSKNQKIKNQELRKV